MKLQDLLKNAPPYQLQGPENPSITELSQDTRHTKRDAVFVTIRGAKHDSHDLLPQVIEKQPSVLVVEDSKKIPSGFKGTVLTTRNSRLFLDFLSHQWFNKPSEKLVCIGVTGTNGKTTTTNIIEQIFNDQNQLTGVIGTINHHLGAKVWPTELTTPGSIALHQRLSEFVSNGARALSIEVSSHALSQHRGEFIEFDAALFTNLTRDHLDYHQNMENYFETKLRLFNDLLARSKKKPKIAVVNVDDPYGQKLLSMVKTPVLSFGQGAGETSPGLAFEILQEDFSGTRLQIRFEDKTAELQLQVPCRYNVYNSLGALGVALGLGLKFDRALESLEKFRGVSGRLERVIHGERFHVFVDYAHTDDALQNVLGSLRNIRTKQRSKSRIITVFGCGGDRDKGKRPLMAKAAFEGSDFVVVTSDNPRTEDPKKIIEDILTGIPKTALGKTVFTEVQRREAIEMALNLAQEDDVVVIAGKGHEDYQIIGQTKYPFSDVQVVREILT